MGQIIAPKRRLSFAIFVSILMVSISGCRTLSETEKQAAFVGKSSGRDLYAFDFAYNRFLVASMQNRQIKALSNLYCEAGSEVNKRERIGESESQYYISGVLMRQKYYTDRIVIQCR